MINELAYVVVHTPYLDSWVDMAKSAAGMEAVTVAEEQYVRLRIDEKTQRFLLVSSPESSSLIMGYGVESLTDLKLFITRLENSGIDFERLEEKELELRGVEDSIRFKDPDGNFIEIAYGLKNADTVFSPSRPIGGFKTGNLGMGHVALKAGNYEEMIAFYGGLLGFKLTDRATKPFKVEFFHVNPRHHTLGIADAGTGPGIYHVMVEYNEFDDIGRSYDIALENPDSIGVTLGRHTNDHVTSFYVKTPDGWMLELGWAGRLINDDWEVDNDLPGLSLWGHDRTWLPPEMRKNARVLLKEISDKGIRFPLDI